MEKMVIIFRASALREYDLDLTDIFLLTHHKASKSPCNTLLASALKKSERLLQHRRLVLIKKGLLKREVDAFSYSVTDIGLECITPKKRSNEQESTVYSQL